MSGSGDEDGDTFFSYPTVRRDDEFHEILHGVRVDDPYRHLEDPSTPEAAEFVAAQNALTQNYLFNCGVDRSQIHEMLQANYNYPKLGTYERCGELYAFFKKEGLQNQHVLYTCETVGGPLSVLLDPNLLSEDGTTSISSSSFSHSGRKLAYGLSEGGSDWKRIFVRDVPSALDERDELRWVKFSSIEWAHDDSGFYYNRFRAPDGSTQESARSTSSTRGMQVFFHLLGTPQAEDELVFECAEDPELMFDTTLTDDGAYLVLTLRRGKFNQLWYKDAQTPPPPPPPPAILEQPPTDSAGRWGFTKLIDDFAAKWELVTSDGPLWTLFTNEGAPRYRLVQISLEQPAREHWRDLVPEGEHTLGGGDYAAGGHCVGGKLILKCMNHVKDELRQYSLEGLFECAIPLPELGVVSAVSGRRRDSEVFFTFESFLTPPVVYRYLPATRACEPVLRTEVPGLDTSDFLIEQRFATSKDGTLVPLFIVRAKEFVYDGRSGAALFGYGGFNVVKTVSFDPVQLTLLQLLSLDRGETGFWGGATTGASPKRMRGVWALANIRGGGEYGREWHQAGTKAHKQNCFDDFIACAELLIEQQYTSPAKLCIHGASNGGLLVTACANQRPELFGCVLSQVGLLDMLRFHKFTIGHFWCADYGSPDEQEAFEYIRRYSPYHNVRTVPPEGEQHRADYRPYPAAIFTTADHDDRVVPLHTFKLVARLQHEAAKAPNAHLRPILARIETKAGHGAGTATSKRLAQSADLFTFVCKALGVTLDPQ